MEKMTSLKVNCWLQWLTVTLALLSKVPAMPVDVDRVCIAPSAAKYRLTFTGQWTQTAFPKHYPLYRPPAQWSPIIGEWADLISKNGILLNICNICYTTFWVCSPKPFTLFLLRGFDPD